MANLPEQKVTNNEPGHKKGDGQPDQITSPDMNNRIKSLFADDVFKVLGIVAFVAWMISEFVPDSHKLFLFVAIASGLFTKARG